MVRDLVVEEARIAVLPAHVVDQIAAGEVIERPASVVKELVDNAIDAGARTITVEATAGGRALIRVTDDGCGMSPRDALLAFERHATSKLRAVDDLWGLTTMGFRGEALPSIASVSRLALTTRRAADLAATRITFEDGVRMATSDVGAPVGTTVEVADLLHNVPARLKFLRGDATEATHITELVARVAMAHPELHLRLRHNGRTALDVPPDRDGLSRARALLGARIGPRLVAAHGEEAGIRVTAFLAGPELAQTTARGVQLFVGRRAIRDRGLLHAVSMGYGELIVRGRYPVAIVMLDAPAGAVDLNVHPQKLEVRFADAGAVCAAVRHVVQAGVATAPWRAESGAGPVPMMAISAVAAPALPFDGPATPLAHRYARELRARDRLGSQASLGFEPPASPRAWVDAIREKSNASRHTERSAELALARAEARSAVDHPAPAHAAGQILPFDTALAASLTRGDFDAPIVPEPIAPPPAVPATEPVELAEGSGPTPRAAGYFAGLRYLGQLDLTYLVCEAAGELVLVDQHAAHERVELARLVRRSAHEHAPGGAKRRSPYDDDSSSSRSTGPAVQKLLFPVTIDASPAQLELVERAREILAAVGYEAEAFGKATLAIKAVPAGIRHGDPAQLLGELLAAWDDGLTPEQHVARALAAIACRSVVRAGDRLAPNEAESLLRSLDDADVEAAASAQAVHGRALLLRFPIAEIGRRFGR